VTTCFYCLGPHETGSCVTRSIRRIKSSREDMSRDIADVIEKWGYRMSEQLSKVDPSLLDSLSNIEQAIEELHSFLSWAHSEIVWRMEKQIELLTGIHDMLKNPRATQANELYKMGIDSYRNHRLADASRLLLEARDLNPGDYRVHVTLGHIYVQRNAMAEALECFKAAVDYARKSDYRRDALLLVCRASRSLGLIDEAISAAREASSLEPHYPLAYYELAGCIAQKATG